MAERHRNQTLPCQLFEDRIEVLSRGTCICDQRVGKFGVVEAFAGRTTNEGSVGTGGFIPEITVDRVIQGQVFGFIISGMLVQ